MGLEPSLNFIHPDPSLSLSLSRSGGRHRRHGVEGVPFWRRVRSQIASKDKSKISSYLLGDILLIILPLLSGL